MKKTLSTILLISAFLTVYSQKTVKVCGDYVYIPPENISIEQAKRIAIERAKLKALEDEFGSVVSQSNTSVTKSNNEQFSESFWSLGGTEVKGDWLEDIENEVKPSYEDNTLIIKAHVCGKGREITAAKADLKVETFCNGINSETFKSGDKFSIKFKSPVAGFVAVFFLDQVTDKVYCLLPYYNENGQARTIKARTDYEFLSSKDPLYPVDIEDMSLEAEKEIDMNHVFCVFSKNEFSMPLTNDGEIAELPFDQYIKWLQKNKTKDVDMQVVEKVIEIRK